jgi:cytoskeletal protein RodZ
MSAVFRLPACFSCFNKNLLRIISMRSSLFSAKRLATGLSAAVTLGAGLFAAHPALAQTQYNFTSFDVNIVDANGFAGFNTAIFGINDSGQIVGSYMTPTEYDSLGDVIALPTTTGFVGTTASQTAVTGPAAEASTDNPFTEVNKINNAGVYAGDFEAVGLTGAEAPQGFTGTGGSAVSTTLNNSQALGINSAGSTVGEVLSGDGTYNRSYLQDSTGVITVFDVPSYGTSEATAINDSGVIIGSAALDPLTGPTVSYVRTSGATPTFSFLSVPGATDVFAQGINNAGSIVGGYVGANGAEFGFLDVGGTYTNIVFPDALATEAEGINSQGQIVGVYADANGDQHGFIATAAAVPEASTTVSLGLLLGLGGILVVAKRRKATAAA